VPEVCKVAVVKLKDYIQVR